MTVDHVARAPGNLAGKIRDLDRARGLARAWATAVDWAEGEGPALAAGSLDVDQAVGAQLRRLARLVGAPEAADDAAQRALVRAQLRAIRSRGTGDDLLGVLDALWPGEGTLEEHFPAGQLLGSPHGVDADFAAAAGRLLAHSRSAAVYTQLHYSPAPEAETFRLGLDPYAGMTPAEVFEAAVGVSADVLFGGALTDAAGGAATLSVEGGAALEAPEKKVYARWGGGGCYGIPGANDDAFACSDAAAFDVSDVESVAIFVLAIFREDLPASLARCILGKQDMSDPERGGWQFFSRPTVGTPGPVFRLDPDPGSLVECALTTASYAPGVRGFVGKVNRTSGQMSFGSDLEATVSTAAPTGCSTSFPLRIGDSRPTDAVVIPAGEQVLLCAEVRGRAAEGIDPHDAAVALVRAVCGFAISSARGLSDEATRTQGGELSGVVVV